ncbi:MAG: asparagine synthase (glutamine-hydrolyzing) [Thermodesulfobacteriota bacterium]
MCGICGYLDLTGSPIDRDILLSMTASLAHRGPDDHGIYINPIGQTGGSGLYPSIGMGHRRLSIIDVSSAASQPMANEDECIWVVFNGEIYNFSELRRECINRRHEFRSRSDTEVLLHLYEDYGIDFIQKLNGMFAFALWDERDGKLFLVRDRIGKKPLYYSQIGSTLVFASELKALLAHPQVKREIDIESFGKYLLYEYVPTPDSIFKGVKKLRPGYVLSASRQGIWEKCYWYLDFTPKIEASEEQINEEIMNLFRDSLYKRLISDVPLGVFLSGGLDSSSIVAGLSELIPGSEIKTFSIGFKDKSFDESSYAREVARYFGTDHHEEIMSPGCMIEILPEVINFLDEPFADASIIPTYLLSKFTRSEVTVALGGDGGDELFAGYPTFLAHKMALFYERLPSSLHNAVVSLASLLPVSMDNISFDFKVKQFLKGIPYEVPNRNQIWLGAFSPEEQKRLFSKEVLANLNGFNPFSNIEESLESVSYEDIMDQITFLYLKFYLPDDILTKVDRASMAASLEVRAPFLDYRLVDYVNRLPFRYKLKGLTTKYILKRCMRNKIPEQIINRNKKGFGVPIAKWFKDELRATLLDSLSEAKIKKEGFFNYRYIKSLLDEHFAGRKDNRKQLWTLFMFEQWYERWSY